MLLHEYLEKANENLNYGNITRDNFWNRGLWMYTNSKEMVVHEKTLEILQITEVNDDSIYVKDEYLDKYIEEYGASNVNKLSEFN